MESGYMTFTDMAFGHVRFVVSEEVMTMSENNQAFLEVRG